MTAIGAGASAHGELRSELWMCCVNESWIGPVVFDLVSATMRATYAGGSLIIKTRPRTFDTRNLWNYPGGRIGQFAFITVRESGTSLS